MYVDSGIRRLVREEVMYCGSGDRGRGWNMLEGFSAHDLS